VPRVTVVNDNPDFLELVGEILAQDQYTTTLVDGDAADALDRIRSSEPDVLMIDLRMGDHELHGWSIAQQVRADETLAGLPILICSADSAAVESIRGQLDGARDVATMTKPFGVDELCAAIDRLVSRPAPR
jgi:two-component system chemotaxis response regulator CheY